MKPRIWGGSLEKKMKLRWVVLKKEESDVGRLKKDEVGVGRLKKKDEAEDLGWVA